jgi:hypothetical protein
MIAGRRSGFICGIQSQVALYACTSCASLVPSCKMALVMSLKYILANSSTLIQAAHPVSYIWACFLVWTRVKFNPDLTPLLEQITNGNFYIRLLRPRHMTPSFLWRFVFHQARCLPGLNQPLSQTFLGVVGSRTFYRIFPTTVQKKVVNQSVVQSVNFITTYPVGGGY